MALTERQIAISLLETPPSNFAPVVEAIVQGAIPSCPFCGATGEWLEAWDMEHASLVELIADQEDDWYVWRQRRRPGSHSRWRCERCGLVCNEPTLGHHHDTRNWPMQVHPTRFATSTAAELHAHAYHEVVKRH